MGGVRPVGDWLKRFEPPNRHVFEPQLVDGWQRMYCCVNVGCSVRYYQFKSVLLSKQGVCRGTPKH